MKLTWKRDPALTGLARIGSGPRPSRLHNGTITYARVSALHNGGRAHGWYWVAGWDSCVPHQNTCESPVATEDEAKAEARAYVLANLPIEPKV